MEKISHQKKITGPSCKGSGFSFFLRIFAIWRNGFSKIYIYIYSVDQTFFKYQSPNIEKNSKKSPYFYTLFNTSSQDIKGF
jgi:hypothetical protein